MVLNSAFREDLYHRLSVIPLFIPPIRKRGDDVLVLADYFIEKFSEKLNKSVRGLSHEVKHIFLNYNWNGNVREIQNTIEYCINMTTAEYIVKDDLPFQFQNKESKNNIMTLDEIEKSLDRILKCTLCQGHYKKTKQEKMILKKGVIFFKFHNLNIKIYIHLFQL